MYSKHFILLKSDHCSNLFEDGKSGVSWTAVRLDSCHELTPFLANCCMAAQFARSNAAHLESRWLVSYSEKRIIIECNICFVEKKISYNIVQFKATIIDIWFRWWWIEGGLPHIGFPPASWLASGNRTINDDVMGFLSGLWVSGITLLCLKRTEAAGYY